MKYVYASRTGNVESLIASLGLDALQIVDGSEVVNEPFVLFTYTDGYGDIPAEVDAFLANNSSNLKGVVVSGDRGYGEAYCGAGAKIVETYGSKVLYEVENAGTDEDFAKIKEVLATL